MLKLRGCFHIRGHSLQMSPHVRRHAYIAAAAKAMLMILMCYNTGVGHLELSVLARVNRKRKQNDVLTAHSDVNPQDACSPVQFIGPEMIVRVDCM